MKDLLRIADLAPDGLDRLLNLAAASKRAPHAFGGMLAGETVVCFFATPSTRTRLSFATAVTRLGGVPQIVGPNEFQLGRGETIADTAAVISRRGDDSGGQCSDGHASSVSSDRRPHDSS